MILTRVGQHEDLRLGADYKPWQPKTHFAFPEDNGSFASANLRCVGVGACRKTDAGTMCPSFMATGEELHSTRGRAHLLWELMQDEVLPNQWQNEQVKVQPTWDETHKVPRSSSGM